MRKIRSGIEKEEFWYNKASKIRNSLLKIVRLKTWANGVKVVVVLYFCLEMQIRMVKQIMRKTSDNRDLNHFKNELYITEICKADDFYRTFGYDEDEVKAYIELNSNNA